MIKYMLRLLPDGDIDIITEKENFLCDYQIVYHKTYNPSDDLKDNLTKAYEEWERLTETEKRKIK